MFSNELKTNEDISTNEITL